MMPDNGHKHTWSALSGSLDKVAPIIFCTIFEINTVTIFDLTLGLMSATPSRCMCWLAMQFRRVDHTIWTLSSKGLDLDSRLFFFLVFPAILHSQVTIASSFLWTGIWDDWKTFWAKRRRLARGSPSPSNLFTSSETKAEHIYKHSIRQRRQ